MAKLAGQVVSVSENGDLITDIENSGIVFPAHFLTELTQEQLMAGFEGNM